MGKKRAKKGSRITPEEAMRMFNLYQELGTYAAVAKKTGRSASAVAKHIQVIAAAKYVQL